MHFLVLVLYLISLMHGHQLFKIDQCPTSKSYTHLLRTCRKNAIWFNNVPVKPHPFLLRSPTVVTTNNVMTPRRHPQFSERKHTVFIMQYKLLINVSVCFQGLVSYAMLRRILGQFCVYVTCGHYIFVCYTWRQVYFIVNFVSCTFSQYKPISQHN